MEWVKLGEIASLITKGTTPTTLGFDFVDEGINFIKIESLSEEGSFISNKFNHITSECDNKLSRSRLQKNDLLFSIAGAIGRTAIVTDDILPANTNQALALIRIPEGVVNYSYLKYVLQSSVVSDQFEKRKQGVAQLNISLKDVANFNIPLPSQAEQQMIVEILGGVEVIISLRKQQLAKLDELVKARFVELFGGRNYPQTPLIQLIVDGAGLSYGIIVPGDNVEDGVPMVRPSDFKNDELCLDNVYKVAPEIEAKYARTRLIGDEILVQVIGQPGQIMLSDSRCKGMNVTRNLAVVRPDGNRINRIYLKIYMQTQEAQAFMLGETKQSTLKQLPLGRLKELEVPVPPMELQNQFATFVEQTDKSKLSIQQSITQLETLKASLMQKYFG